MRKEKEKKDVEMESKKDMDTSDPSAGIMNLMKKMYDEGKSFHLMCVREVSFCYNNGS